MEYPTSGQSPNAASISGEAAAMLNTFWPDAMKDIRDLKNVGRFVFNKQTY